MYTKALDLDKSNHTIYSNRSAAYLQTRQYESALADAEMCIKLNEKWAKGHIRKGNVYLQQKKFDEAENIYKNGLDICNEKQALNKALDDLDFQRIGQMDKQDKIVGGRHAQAEKFRILINWLIDGGAKVESN